MKFEIRKVDGTFKIRLMTDRGWVWLEDESLGLYGNFSREEDAVECVENYVKTILNYKRRVTGDLVREISYNTL